MKYRVTGMSCAACQSAVERAVGKVEGVTSCSVSLLTGTMDVEGSAGEKAVVAAVEKAGYGARAMSEGGAAPAEPRESSLSAMVRRLVWSVILLLPLMYITMGHAMWSWPLPALLSGNPMAIALMELILSTLIIVINQKFYISGFRALFHLSPNMDSLVALGSGASLLWSLVLIFRMTALPVEEAMHLLHSLYLESAAMILTLITVGKTLEERSKGRTGDALRALMALKPATCRLEKDGETIECDISCLMPGSVFVLLPGDSVPADAVVISGSGSFDESALTGESIPVEKSEGDSVLTSTINLTGTLRCRAVHTGDDTTLSRIIRMVEDASASKAPIQKIADTVSSFFVPAVMGIALVTFIVWYSITGDVALSLERGISVLVISCPCALGLATPVAIMVGSGKGARNGILYKSAEALEEMGRAEIVVLDKTGTLTVGRPSVSSVTPEEGVEEGELMSLALSLEKDSGHPLSLAVIEEGRRRGTIPFNLDSFNTLPGMGVEGTIGDERIWGGRKEMAPSSSPALLQRAKAEESDGRTLLFFGKGERTLGFISVSDTLKKDSVRAVAELEGMGIRTVLLTGDNEGTARAMAEKAGIREWHAGVLPSGKADVIRALRKEGRTVMAGDGINDAVALKEADVGVAMGGGKDVAVESASVVLLTDSLLDLTAAVRLGRRTLRNIKQNLFWAFFYNSIGIPVACGALIPLFGISITPMFGALAMSLSSFCVVSNALRLNTVDVHDNRHDRKRKIRNNEEKSVKEEKIMEYELEIEGMMCPHCEARVKKTLEAVSGVESAVVSHKDGNARVSGKALDKEALKAAVENEGYSVTSIR